MKNVSMVMSIFLKSLPFFVLMLIYSLFNNAVAFASVTWHSYCSNISSDTVDHHINSLEVTNYTVKIPDNSNVFLNSKQLMVNQSGKTLSKDQLQRVTNITSTGLLTVFLKYQINSCNKNYYTDSITPILKQLKQNEQLTIIWRNIIIKNLNNAYKADEIRLQVQNIADNVNLKLFFSGLNEINPSQKSNLFLPREGILNLNTPTKYYPLILAAASGNNEDKFYDLSLPLKINNLMMQNNLTHITAYGNALLDRELNFQSAKGKITVSNMEKLIANSGSTRINNLKTALILAKFAGRSVGNNNLEWDINWQGNLFKVNNVPIPVW